MSGAGSIRLDGKVALVTGAAGGLGLSHARELLQRGARVVLADFSPAVEDSARGLGEGAAFASLDVSSADDCRRVVAEAIEAHDRLDILVNNAGILRDHTIEKQTDAEWAAVVDVHLNGTRHMTFAAWDALKAAHGCIINTTSASGLYGNIGQTNYAAAKLGIVGFSKSCALEGRRHGVRVNCIAPVALTPMTDRLWTDERTRRGTEPELVSPVVAFLASDQCTETGLVLAVGGGYMARVAILEAEGVDLPAGERMTAEWVADNLARASDLSCWSEPASVIVALERAFGR